MAWVIAGFHRTQRRRTRIHLGPVCAPRSSKAPAQFLRQQFQRKRVQSRVRNLRAAPFGEQKEMVERLCREKTNARFVGLPDAALHLRATAARSILCISTRYSTKRPCSVAGSVLSVTSRTSTDCCSRPATGGTS